MNRRKLLKTTVLASVGVSSGLAGCSSQGGEGDTTPDSSNNDTPSNTGNGETPSGTGNQETPAETESEGGSDSSDDLGRTQVSANSIQTTVEDALTTRQYGSAGDMTTAESGRKFLFVKANSINNGDESQEVPGQSGFNVRDGSDIQQEQRNLSEISEPVANVYATSGFGTSIDVGSRVSGWLAFEVDESSTDFTVEVPDFANSDGNPFQWELSLPAEPTVAIEETVDGPSEVTAGSNVTLTHQVTNSGSRSARVSRELIVVEPDFKQAVLEQTVEPGETATNELSFPTATVGDYSVTTSTDTYDSVTVMPVELAFGETWDVGNGLQITLSDVHLTDEIVYTAKGTSGRLQLDAPTGKQFFVCRFESEANEIFYWRPTLSVSNGRSEGTEHQDIVSGRLEGYDHTIEEPISGRQVEFDDYNFTLGKADVPDFSGGVVVIEVPNSFSMESLSVRYEDRDDYELEYNAIWS